MDVGITGFASETQGCVAEEDVVMSEGMEAAVTNDASASTVVPPSNLKVGPPSELEPALSHADVLDHLQDITKDMRERKATKSDDAPVPMSLWEEHLVDDGTQVWTVEEKKLLPRACDTLRKRMLYWWKGRVLSTFHLWLNRKYRDELLPINERWDLGVTFRNGRYEWAKGEESKNEYLKWRKARLLICKEDLLAGTDAVVRAFCTSWWEWEDGSRPFHWRWPLEYQERIHDGIRVHFREEPPRYTVPQREVRDN